VKATLGSKPGAEAVLEVLLSAGDLPDGPWTQQDERTWRTGEASSDTAWASRAREIDSITAWRSFEDRDVSQWLWCQLTPLASPDDAALALLDLPSRMLANLRADIEVIGGTDVAPPAVPGAGRIWAHEQTTAGPRGGGMVRYLAGTVGEYLFVVCASGAPDGLSWSTVAEVAHAQSARIPRRPTGEDDV
jgi:hypothetical protein